MRNEEQVPRIPGCVSLEILARCAESALAVRKGAGGSIWRVRQDERTESGADGRGRRIGAAARSY